MIFEVLSYLLYFQIHNNSLIHFRNKIRPSPNMYEVIQIDIYIPAARRIDFNALFLKRFDCYFGWWCCTYVHCISHLQEGGWSLFYDFDFPEWGTK